MKLILLLAAPLLASAACPNACSGHGKCGTNDACVCHSNWIGGDCSQRVCHYHHAWVTTSNGDVNNDGDEFDATTYSDDYKFVSSGSFLSTLARPGGDFEMWPSTHTQSTDEGHFYMECANQGLCNRKTGICECFDGYEGLACKRSTCPNDCSGHGLCKTVGELLSEHNDINGDTRVYKLWDKDMRRTCSCDPGYTGYDCSEKKCPHGDDPLTTKYQVNEVQWIEIRSEKASVTTSLDGTATFTYKDHFGKTWTTDPIDIQRYDGSDAANQMATDLESVLEGLPNGVLTDVSVTAGYCEKVLPNKFLDFDANSASANKYNSGTNPASGYLRCPGMNDANPATSQDHLLVDPSDTSIFMNSFAGSGSSTYEDTALAGTPETHTGDRTCNLIVYPECVRFRIEFLEQPGDLSEITANIGNVNVDSKTNSQDSASLITTNTWDKLELVDDSTFSVGYTLTSTQEVTSDNTGVITPSATAGASTVTFGTPTGSATFPKDSKVTITCTENSVTTLLGTYTVYTTWTTGTLNIKEKIIAPNGECASAGGTIKVKLVTHYLHTNVDLGNENLIGMAVNVDTYMDSGDYTGTTVETVTFPADGTVTGTIMLDGTSTLSQTVADATGSKLVIYGKGTKENNECGDRGLCDRETGVCSCFQGYTGDSCSTQHSLAA